MAKDQGGGELLPLPFTTFGEIAALGLKATVYCSGCYEHRPIEPAAENLRDRCFATTRFRCNKIRYTGAVCGCSGSVVIKPAMLLPVGGEDTLAFLYCSTCEPSWEINHMRLPTPLSVRSEATTRGTSRSIASDAVAGRPLRWFTRTSLSDVGAKQLSLAL
jgi:hypothetical protein